MSASQRFPPDALVLSAVIHPASLGPPGWDKLTWVDDEGRPLVESHAPADLFAGVVLDLRTCPFPDPRLHHERPMNVSALKQVRRHWDRTKAIYVGLRTLVRADAGPLTVDELWRLSYLAFAVPPYLVLRTGSPRIPSWSAALFKTGLGLTPLTMLRLEALLAGEPDQAVTSQAVLDAAYQHGSLIGDRHVCAGSPSMILDVLDHVVSPRAGSPAVALTELLDDPDGFRRFGLELLNGCTVVYLFFLARQLLTGDLRRAFPENIPEDLDRVSVDPNTHPFLDVLDETTDQDKADLLRAIGSLIRPTGGQSAPAPELPRLVDELAQQWSRTAADPVAAAVGEQPLAGLLVVALRLERCFLASVRAVEAELRRALALAPYAGPLDATLTDRLYGNHPRAVLAALLGVDVHVSDTEAAVVRGELRIPV